MASVGVQKSDQSGLNDEFVEEKVEHGYARILLLNAHRPWLPTAATSTFTTTRKRPIFSFCMMSCCLNVMMINATKPTMISI